MKSKSLSVALLSLVVVPLVAGCALRLLGQLAEWMWSPGLGLDQYALVGFLGGYFLLVQDNLARSRMRDMEE